MSGSSPVSRAPNGEDIVLLRALGHLGRVRFAVLTTDRDGANPPTEALESAGWEGTRTAVDGASRGVGDAVAALEATGGPLHVLWCATPELAGSIFPAVARSAERPWVVLVEQSAPDHGPLGADATDAGYAARLFDGVTQFFVAREHDELSAALSYPRCSRDAFETYAEVQLREEAASLLREVIHWRRIAVTGWAEALGAATTRWSDTSALAESARLQDDLTAMKQTVSWRVTRPLRALRRVPRRLRPRS